MSPQPWPGPPSSKPLATHPTGAHELNPPPLQTDVAELAAHFAEKSSGGITAEMASEIALDVVLNEIVEQACQSTNATGSAIALLRSGEMVCRATSGATAPDLGARLDTSSGLTGECCSTGRTQRCDDALADLRVDIEASARLGVRAVIVMPLVRAGELVGVFELLSCWPSAFIERDERCMEELAGRAVRSLDRAEQATRRIEEKWAAENRAANREQAPREPEPDRLDAYREPELELARKISEAELANASLMQVEAASSPEQADTSQIGVNQIALSQARANQGVVNQAHPNQPHVHQAQVNPVRRNGFDFLSFSLGAAVLACTALLGVTLGRRFELRRISGATHHATQPTQAAATRTAAPAPTGADPAPQASTPQTSASQTSTPQASTPQASASQASASAASTPAADVGPAQSQGAAAVPAAGPVVPPGGLVVYDSGREVFRMAPNPAQPSPATSKALQLSPADAENILAKRVEPEYPDDARRLKIQGAVVLAIRIGKDGSVENMRFASGPARLADAAVNAVKQWRFKPQTVNGRPVEVETSVTLNFRLPS